MVGNTALNMRRGESDIAVRATDKPAENLFGRKGARIAWAPYVAVAGAGSPKSAASALFDRQWVSYGGQLSGLKAYSFVEERVHRDKIAYRTDSDAGAAAAIDAGLGVGYLACMVGDVFRGLVGAGDIAPQVGAELWFCTLPDIPSSARH